MRGFSRRKLASPSTTSGFTLVEVIVVLSIVGIILAFSIPNFREGRFREEVKAQTRELAADLDFAQSSTIAQRVQETQNERVGGVGIIFTPTGYTVFSDNSPRRSYTATDVDLETVEYAGGVTVSNSLGATEIYFRDTAENGRLVGAPVCRPSTINCTAGLEILVASDLISYQQAISIEESGHIEAVGL